MSHSTQAFTQSLRLLDPINQQRIKQQKRILWPDYQALSLISSFDEAAQKDQTQLDLSNLFMYCAFEEKFIVKKTNKKNYSNLSECYDPEFTHMAIWMCKKRKVCYENSTQTSGFSQNSRSLDNRRKRSVQRLYKSSKIDPQAQQLYIILSKRSIAIDEVIKTNHKVCILVVPLSDQKFLWGGSLNFEELESITSSKPKQQQTSLFKSGGQTFGFNISSKASIGSGSIRKPNGTIDKRQLRFSNYQSSKKQQQQHQNTNNQSKQPKECTNTVKLLPQHIRQHQQFLYIQVDLTSNNQLPERSDEYNFTSVDIFGRHMKPKYGGKYDDLISSESEDQMEDENGSIKRFKRLIKEQIFLIYSMPFMVFNSYLQSQLNFEQNQDMRQINFRGSCMMFSAMKKLQLKSGKKEEPKQQTNQKSLQKARKQKSTFNTIGENNQDYSNSSGRSIPKKQSNSISVREFINQKEEFSGYGQNVQKNGSGFEVIEIFPQKKQSPLSIVNRQNSQKLSIEDIKRQTIRSLWQKFTQPKQGQQNPSQLIYFPVFNAKSFQPLRLAIPLNLLQLMNPKIYKQTTKVQIQSDQLHDTSKQAQVEIDVPLKKSRHSVYIGKNNKKPQVEVDHSNIKYVNINVFLTDKVYKQDAVNLLTDILERFQKIMHLPRQRIEKEHEWIRQFDNLVRVNSTDQLKNLFVLIDDLNQTNESTHHACDLTKLLIWVEQLILFNYLAQSQLQLITFVKKQTSFLLHSSSTLHLIQEQNNQDQHNLSQNQLIDKQLNVISLIKDYHQKSTFDQELKDFFVKLFFFFIAQQTNTQCEFFRSLTLLTNKNSVGQIQSQFKVIEQVFSTFFLMNSSNIIGSNQQLLSSIFKKLSDSLQSSQDVQVDNKHQTNTNFSPLIRLFKSSVTYTIENVSEIPINVFLSKTLEQFENDIEDSSPTNYKQSQHNQNGSSSHAFSCQKLNRFIKKYFVRGHNFLQRQMSQGNNSLDTDKTYINLIADLLNLYIKITNIEKILTNTEQNHIKNVIELINSEYAKCSVNSSNMNFMKVSGKGLLQKVQKITMLKKNEQGQKQTKLHENKVEYNQVNTSFLIKSQELKQSNNDQSSRSPIFTQKPQFKQPKIPSLQLSNTKQSFPLSNNTQSFEKYDFSLSVSQSNAPTQTSRNQLDLQILFKPGNLQSNQHQTSNSLTNDSYQINFLNTQLKLKDHHNNKQATTLFSCYQVIVSVEIVIGKSINSLQTSTLDLQTIYFTGSNILTFDNFSISPITSNVINLQNQQQLHNKVQLKLANIHRVNVQIHSRSLPILQNSLSFINLRLNMYLKSLLASKSPSSHNKSKSSRKTIGGRFTEHLSKRNDTLQIEDNMLVGNRRTKNRLILNNQVKSTLYELPEIALYQLLKADKCYVQDEQALLKFVDEFYERNQPIYKDYILYLAIRPVFLRLSTVLKHFFANRTKYNQSQILKSFIKIKLSSPMIKSESSQIAKLFAQHPRISSLKPLRNVKDTLEERELLTRYAKESSRKASLQKGQNNQSFGQSSLFGKKIPVFEIKESNKEQVKDVEI